MITIYKCQHCGKWSHAQRKPSHHLRTMSSVEGMPDAGGLPVVEERVEPVMEWFNPGAPEPGGGWAHLDDAYTLTVKCGPFDTYAAEKVTA